MLAIFEDLADVRLRRNPADLIADLVNQFDGMFASVDIKVGAVAISLKRRSWPSVDIIPAVMDHDGLNLYQIPAADGKLWQQYSPGSQDALVETCQVRIGPRIKSLIRMIKWWSYRNNLVLASFAIEGLACSSFENFIPTYPEAIYRLFSIAARWPRSAELFAADYEYSIATLKVALDVSAAAIRFGALNTPNGTLRAIKQWRSLFGDKFPDTLE
jgi:hypothetical protein